MPLLMAGAGIPAGRVITQPVGHVDLAATLLALGGASPAAGLRGQSLLPLLAVSSGDEAALSPPFVYAEMHAEGNVTGSFMIRIGRWKLIHFVWFEEQNLFFDMENDPGERRNLRGSAEPIVAAAYERAVSTL